MNEFDLMNAMNELDDRYLLDAQQPPLEMRKSRKSWKRPALIAACLCLALTGTVLAVESGALVRFLNGEAWFGSYENPTDEPIWGGYQAVTAVQVPVSELSDAVRELAAGQDPAYPEYVYAFDSWAEMEDFADLEVANNPLQDTATKRHLTMRGKGTAHQGPVGGYSILSVYGDADGNVKSLRMTSGYGLLKPDDYYVSLTVNAAIATDHADTDTGMEAFDDGSLGRAYTEDELKNLKVEEYAMANGQVAVIVSNPASDGAVRLQHRAYFQGENALINVITSCDHRSYTDADTMELHNQKALQALKEVLDAFE